MKKEIFITKLPTGTPMSELIYDMIGGFGIKTRTKEEVDDDLRAFGVTDLSGTYFRITVEEIGVDDPEPKKSLEDLYEEQDGRETR